MNILEQIFKLENPKLDYKFSEEIYDLLFDWFNENKISIASFEADFFQPIIKVLRTLDHNNKYFENYYEQARREYYLKLAFLYLIYRHPNNELLKRLFLLKNVNSLLSNITGWHSHGTLANNSPEMFQPLTIGAQLARYYHAIYARIDQNFSYLPCNFAQVKFENNATHFSTIFEYVNQQTFEEKPYLMFLLHKSTSQKYNYDKDENGNTINKSVEIISISQYDDIIDLAFENSIQEHNQLYKSNLTKEMFLNLKEFLSYKPIDKKAKLSIDNFVEARELIEATKGKELLILEHIIYYLRNEYLHDQERYWEILLTSICNELICPTDWLEDKIDFLLSKNEEHSSVLKNEIRNANLIFNYIITQLLNNVSPQLSYNDKLVQKYETLLFRRIKTDPYQKGLSVLRSIAINTIENKQERTFVLSKLSSFYFQGNNFDFSYLSLDEKDKSFTTVKSFIEDLNILVPIALKTVNKPKYYTKEDENIFVINYEGKDIEITRHYFVRDINKLLKYSYSPYRLVAIPLTLTAPDRNNYQFIHFSLAFMNEKEYNYFNQNYLLDVNIVKWFVKNDYNDFKLFSSQIRTSENLHPVFTNQTDLSFDELKNYKQTIIKSFKADNIFISDINWEWFKNKYIDELSSREQWYEIMNVICQCPKGKKPTSSWLSNLRNEIEKLGAEKYFKELQVLFSLSLKEESWFFDIYADALKGLVWSCAYIAPNDLSLSIIKSIAEHSYTKIYGVGAKSTKTGNIALEALVATQKEEAFGILNIMRNKTKYNKFAVALEKSIDKFKENSTISEQLLADRSIPNFDFKEGKKIFEIADHKLIVSFKNTKLIKHYEDKEGNSLKHPPTQLSKEYTKELKEINEETKQINSVFNDLVKRIKTYWLYDRVWSFSDWNKYIKGHDLIYPHIENLIWTNKTKNKDFILRNNQLLEVDNKFITSSPEDEISLWHPVINSEENISKWQNYLWDNNIVQNQRQAFRENYPFSEAELELFETPRFAHHFLEVQKLMAIANYAGWIFTYVHEGVNWPRIYLKPLNISAHLTCDYDRNSYAIPTKQLYFTRDNSTRINESKAQNSFEKIKLSEISKITLSEICRDIDLFIATSSIANNVELSENKQEYDTYSTEYQKGLFSDNANAKIRSKVIEKLVPILKLNIERFEGNFVIVKGKSDNYKINLNSGFAQTFQTQKHINLIPDIKKLKSDKKLRMPIEDDETLYIILAKMLYFQTI